MLPSFGYFLPIYFVSTDFPSKVGVNDLHLSQNDPSVGRNLLHQQQQRRHHLSNSHPSHYHAQSPQGHQPPPSQLQQHLLAASTGSPTSAFVKTSQWLSGCMAANGKPCITHSKEILRRSAENKDGYNCGRGQSPQHLISRGLGIESKRCSTELPVTHEIMSGDVNSHRYRNRTQNRNNTHTGTTDVMSTDSAREDSEIYNLSASERLSATEGSPRFAHCGEGCECSSSKRTSRDSYNVTDQSQCVHCPKCIVPSSKTVILTESLTICENGRESFVNSHKKHNTLQNGYSEKSETHYLPDNKTYSEITNSTVDVSPRENEIKPLPTSQISNKSKSEYCQQSVGVGSVHTSRRHELRGERCSECTFVKDSNVSNHCETERTSHSKQLYDGNASCNKSVRIQSPCSEDFDTFIGIVSVNEKLNMERQFFLKPALKFHSPRCKSDHEEINSNCRQSSNTTPTKENKSTDAQKNCENQPPKNEDPQKERVIGGTTLHESDHRNTPNNKPSPHQEEADLESMEDACNAGGARNYYYEEKKTSDSDISHTPFAGMKNRSDGIAVCNFPRPFSSTKSDSLYKRLSQSYVHFSEKQKRYMMISSEELGGSSSKSEFSENVKIASHMKGPAYHLNRNDSNCNNLYNNNINDNDYCNFRSIDYSNVNKNQSSTIISTSSVVENNHKSNHNYGLSNDGNNKVSFDDQDSNKIDDNTSIMKKNNSYNNGNSNNSTNYKNDDESNSNHMNNDNSNNNNIATSNNYISDLNADGHFQSQLSTQGKSQKVTPYVDSFIMEEEGNSESLAGMEKFHTHFNNIVKKLEFNSDSLLGASQTIDSLDLSVSNPHPQQPLSLLSLIVPCSSTIEMPTLHSQDSGFKATPHSSRGGLSSVVCDGFSSSGCAPRRPTFSRNSQRSTSLDDSINDLNLPRRKLTAVDLAEDATMQIHNKCLKKRSIDILEVSETEMSVNISPGEVSIATGSNNCEVSKNLAEDQESYLISLPDYFPDISSVADESDNENGKGKDVLGEAKICAVDEDIHPNNCYGDSPDVNDSHDNNGKDSSQKITFSSSEFSRNHVNRMKEYSDSRSDNSSITKSNTRKARIHLSPDMHSDDTTLGNINSKDRHVNYASGEIDSHKSYLSSPEDMISSKLAGHKHRSTSLQFDKLPKSPSLIRDQTPNSKLISPSINGVSSCESLTHTGSNDGSIVPLLSSSQVASVQSPRLFSLPAVAVGSNNLILAKEAPSSVHSASPLLSSCEYKLSLSQHNPEILRQNNKCSSAKLSNDSSCTDDITDKLSSHLDNSSHVEEEKSKDKGQVSLIYYLQMLHLPITFEIFVKASVQRSNLGLFLDISISL